MSRELIPNTPQLPAIDRLEGRFVNLQPFLYTDISPEYVSWLNDPRVVQFSNQRFLQHSDLSCRNYLASFNETPNRFFKILKQTDGLMVGTMTAYYNPYHNTVDLGILVGDRSSWGQGVGLDAWSTLMNWLLSHAQVRKVTGGTMQCNKAMVKIMKHSGMALEAVHLKQELLDGKPQDLVYFGKFRNKL